MNYELKTIQNFELENFDGSKFDLYEFGKDSFVLLVFFRGAWCSLCKKQLLELQAHLGEFDKLKIKIVAIAADSKFKLSLLKTFLKLDFTILADEKFTVINQFNLKTSYKDKPVSKPAVFLMNLQHGIVFSYIGEDYDDRLAVSEILSKIREII